MLPGQTPAQPPQERGDIVWKLQSADGVKLMPPPRPDAPIKGFVPGGIKLGERGKAAPKRGAPDTDAPIPGDAQWGTKFPWLGVSNTGVYAGNQADLNITLPTTTYTGGNGGVWLYAPTLYGADDCLLEVVTGYHRLANSDNDGGILGDSSVVPAGSMERFIGLYDHKTGVKRFVYAIDMSWSWFQSAYLRDFYSAYTGAYQGKLYFAKIERVSGSWRAYLYDFNAGAWTGMNNGYSTSGSGAAAGYGWNQFETYYFQNSSTPCPQMPMVNGTRAQQLTSSGWQATTGALNDMGTQLQCPSTWNSHKSFTHNYDDWVVKTQ